MIQSTLEPFISTSTKDFVGPFQEVFTDIYEEDIAEQEKSDETEWRCGKYEKQRVSFYRNGL